MKNKTETNNNLDLEKIIDEYSNYVDRIIRNMANLSNEDIEEIVSDTFFILWKNREKIDMQRKLSSYIAGIVRNLVREKTRVISINADISDYENTIQDFIKIDMLCEQRDEISIIEKTVKSMKNEDICIFNLYYYTSMKIEEISEVTNMSQFSVKSRLYRIRKKVKKELEKGGYSSGE